MAIRNTGAVRTPASIARRRYRADSRALTSRAFDTFSLADSFPLLTTVASKPASSTASTSCRMPNSTLSSHTTTAECVNTSARASNTPSTPFNAVSTAEEQLEHVIPTTRSSTLDGSSSFRTAHPNPHDSTSPTISSTDILDASYSTRA